MTVKYVKAELHVDSPADVDFSIEPNRILTVTVTSGVVKAEDKRTKWGGMW